MKRDFDLIREILITLENEPNSRADLFARHFPEWEAMRSITTFGCCCNRA